MESLSYGCNVNTRTEDSGETALHLASTSGEADFDLVKELLQAGAGMDLQEAQGKTALFLACESENADLVQLLLDCKASPDVKANGKSCIDVAEAKSCESIVKMITRSVQPDEPVDKEAVKERKRAAAEKKKRERAETFQQHNPMERAQDSEGGDNSDGGDDESEADYDESGDDDSGSGWSDFAESSKAEEVSAAASADVEASEKSERNKEDESEAAKESEEIERKREEERKKAERSTAAAAQQTTQTDVDYKSTDLYKEFAEFKQRLSTNSP